MKIKSVLLASQEARRFLKAEKAWRDRIDLEDMEHWRASKEGGALRRASLDLTRALAELRKP